MNKTSNYHITNILLKDVFVQIMCDWKTAEITHDTSFRGVMNNNVNTYWQREMSGQWATI